VASIGNASAQDLIDTLNRHGAELKANAAVEKAQTETPAAQAAQTNGGKTNGESEATGQGSNQTQDAQSGGHTQSRRTDGSDKSRENQPRGIAKSGKEVSVSSDRQIHNVLTPNNVAPDFTKLKTLPREKWSAGQHEVAKDLTELGVRNVIFYDPSENPTAKNSAGFMFDAAAGVCDIVIPTKSDAKSKRRTRVFTLYVYVYRRAQKTDFG